MIEWDLDKPAVVRSAETLVVRFAKGISGDECLIFRRHRRGLAQSLVLRNMQTGAERSIVRSLALYPNPYRLTAALLSPNGQFAVFGVYPKSRSHDRGELWLVNLHNLKAVKVTNSWAEVGSFSADGNKVCVRVGRTRNTWWRFYDDYRFAHQPAQLYVLDISRAYKDLDGAKAFDVRDFIKAEWSPLEEAEKDK
jgi:hypothetical protein